MVWGFGGFGRLIGGDSDDERHKAPKKISNSDRHAAVMAEAAALGLMEAQGIACRQHMSQASDKLCQTKPEPVKRPEKTAKAHPKTEISEEKTLKPSEKMAMSEPSGDSSRHAGSASTEEALFCELPGELSAEGTSEASPQVQADFGTSWQADGFGSFGGAGFGDFGHGFGGFNAGTLSPTPESVRTSPCVCLCTGLHCKQRR
eukprot:g23461.t1